MNLRKKIAQNVTPSNQKKKTLFKKQKHSSKWLEETTSDKAELQNQMKRYCLRY
jgi:seryl-tRNA synthetase